MSALACVGLCTNASGTDPMEILGRQSRELRARRVVEVGVLRHPPSDDHFADVKETENKLSQR